MRFIITEEDLDALQVIREAKETTIRVGPSLYHAELLGLVEGSYQGRKGIGTGGGKNRRYQMTDAGFAFMARLDWIKQRL